MASRRMSSLTEVTSQPNKAQRTSEGGEFLFFSPWKPVFIQCITFVDDLRRRDEHLQQARKFLSQGRQKQAFEHFTKCVDVTPAMAYQLIKVLREQDIDYIVAPYEADAQLAYLERRGVIDGIITEDSDLLVFGCQTVLYKLTPEGNCIEVRQSEKARCRSLPFTAFPDESFRQMAILSGCDYLDSIPGMGLKTAHKLLKRFKTVSKALSAARMDGMNVPPTYERDFERAEKTFVYQRVFDRDEQGHFRLVTLTPASSYEGDLDADDCIGADLPEELAKGIARGDIDPITRLPVEGLLTRTSSASAGPMSSNSSSKKTINRAYSAPSRFNKQAKPEPGQRGIKGFFAVAKGESSNSCSRQQETPSRAPLAPKSVNQSVAKQSSSDAVEDEASKFFAKVSPAKEADTSLATFTPRSKRQRTDSLASADSVSSPASSAHVSPQARKLKDLLSSDPVDVDTDVEDVDEDRLTNVSMSWKTKFAYSPDSTMTPRGKPATVKESIKRRRSNVLSIDEGATSKRNITVAEEDYFSSTTVSRREEPNTPSITMGKLEIDSGTLAASNPPSSPPALHATSGGHHQVAAVRPSLESFRCPRGSNRL